MQGTPKHRRWNVPESRMIPLRQFRPSKTPFKSKSAISIFPSRGVLNVRHASRWELRNVSNALGTPASLPTPPDRFWGDLAGTRHTFDNFSDFRFLHFLHWFSFKSAQRAPFGFRRSLQQSGGHPDRSIHPAALIPPEVRILEISHFPEPGKFQENFKKRTLHVTVES